MRGAHWGLALLGGRLLACAALANEPPATPIVTEPAVDGQIVNPADVHMETSPFSDPDPGDSHLCSDWEIWTVAPPERVWVTACIGGVERVHTHLGDGVFENSHAGRSELFFETDYRLRARHRDDSGDPATEWSAWAERLFTTGPPTEIFALELDDILDSPAPQWTDPASAPVILPAGPNAPALRLESPAGELLLEIRGLNGSSNQATNPPPISAHAPVRIVASGGGPGLLLPESDLVFVNDEGEQVTIYLPEMSLVASQQAYFWVSADGSTFYGEAGQAEPSFAELARGAPVPWTVRQPGYIVEVAAMGFQLPVNIAFVPDPGDLPDDPYYYVTELYGQIKVVTRDGSVSDYASGLLNFDPTGQFPGSGEQGLTGIAIDPNTGDVYASLLYDAGGPHYPKVDRFTSLDGGLTAATQTTILDMVGESQGQSHQISNVTFGPDGKLYVHMGDGFDFTTAQNLNSFRGKVLRLNRDGSAPSDNPFFNAGDGINARDYVYAYGLRNPFGGAWRDADGAHYEVENGPSRDRFAKIVAGRNYLWDGSDQSMDNYAIYVWNPAAAPVNIAFIQPALFGGSGFPAEALDRAFVAESGPTWASGPQANGKRVSQFTLDPNGALLSGPTPLVEYNGVGKASAVALAAGPDGLYFSDFYKDLDYASPIDRGSRVLRIRFVGVADFAADATSGPAPLNVSFTNTSNVPEHTAWHWEFGDGATSDLEHPSHAYEQDGTYDVTLRVTGPSGVRVAHKPGFIRVSEFLRAAMLSGSIPQTQADNALANYLRSLGHQVTAYDDEPANRPSAAEFAATRDVVIISSTVASSNIAAEFRDEPVPLVYWEQALNRIDREPLADDGATVGSVTQINLLTNQHPVTYNQPPGVATVFNPAATMSVTRGTLGAGVALLATRAGAPGDYAILAADSGAALLGGRSAPARRVFLCLEDSSWQSATDVTRRLLTQAVLWAAGRDVPTLLGDSDYDGDFDVDDLDALPDCLAGPGVVPAPPAPATADDCQRAFDADDDSDVDLHDVAELMRAFGTP